MTSSLAAEVTEDLFEMIVGQGLYRLRRQGFYGVGKYNLTQAAETASAGGGCAQIGECLGQNQNRRDACEFTYCGVVDTPRRAGSSSAEADECGVDLPGELFHPRALFFG